MKKSSKDTKKKSWENDQVVRIIFILIIIVSLGVMFGTAGYSFYKWNENSKYQSRIISINYVNTSVQIVPFGAGMNGDIDSLKFGKSMPGSGGERYLILNSTQEAMVEIQIFGDMSKFLTVDKNDFIMKPKTRDQVTFYLEIPEDTKPGNYTGTIQVVFLKP
jgi:hypothetical protein